MRTGAVRASSSMQALVCAMVAAGGSTAPGALASQPGSTAWRQPAVSSQQVQQRPWHSSSGGGSGGSGRAAFAPLYSDLARQRRLTSTAAAAQPASAEDLAPAAWEQQALRLTVLSPLTFEQAGSSQRQRRRAAANSKAPTLAAAAEAAIESALESTAAAARLVQEAAAAPPPQQLPASHAVRLPVPNLGYTCMNVELQQRHGIRTNRSCRRRTFEAEGLPRVSSLALANCRDLIPLVEWNAANGIHFFRVPSALFPWSHAYELEQLPDYEEIAATLAVVGAAARLHNQRLSTHPSHFVQLGSPEPALLARSLADLELNSKVFDLMGYAPSHVNKINIHVGALRGSKAHSLACFAAAVDRLSPACRARLTVENDDRPNLFSIADLLPLHAMAGVPLVFDYLHHALVPGGLSEQEALEAALATWPQGVRPVVHYSEPSENPALARRAHSRMLTQPFEMYGREAEVDVMLEAKGMDRALLFYRDALHLGRKTETAAVHYRAPPAVPAVTADAKVD